MTSHRRPSSPRLGLAALACGAGLALGGCHAERIVADSYPTTVAQRHPIVLAEGSTRLDLPVGAGAQGLTSRQKEDVRAFAADWRKNGRGPIGMMAPAGAFGATAVRSALASAGVPATQIVSQRYTPAGPEEIGLVKLGYVKLKAQVSHACGLWPDDLGSGGGDLYGATENREYWNFGCANQQNLAAQVADPEDIARPRAEAPIYAARRQTIIEKHREGGDTTTGYRQADAVVSDVAKE
ncbi:CpaD family pilus assembly protein [Chenggangzhangella methanolivorans]|uniref:CpaD family pilus assembly protein n=1 Tax=Chenggangzhangella methanolivorans TaxID=1437009 RepID=UPI0036127BDE